MAEAHDHANHCPCCHPSRFSVSEAEAILQYLFGRRVSMLNVPCDRRSHEKAAGTTHNDWEMLNGVYGARRYLCGKCGHMFLGKGV